MRIPLSITTPDSPFDLFYGKKGSVSHLQPFGCLTYVHLQKDQRKSFESHAIQCILISYPVDYKGWRFWDPEARKEIVSDSAVFQESVFPFQKPGLSAIDKTINSNPITVLPDNSPASVLRLRCPDLPIEGVAPPVDPMLHAPPNAPPPDTPPPALPMPPLPDAIPAPVPIIPASPRLVPVVQLPPPPMDLPERPRTPTEVRKLLSNYEHHPSTDPLPAKRASQARLPGTLAEDANSSTASDTCIPLLDAIECVFSTSLDLEPRTLRNMLSRTDAPKWVEAALKEIEAHIQNGTWELTQLPPGKCAIGSCYVSRILIKYLALMYNKNWGSLNAGSE